MRLLVVSNVSGSVDKIIDLVQQNHNVIAKELPSASTSTLVQNVSGQLTAGTYDQAIVIAKDPIGVCMQLNKRDGIEAAVCDSMEDVQLAKQNGANTIVIRDIDSDALHEVVQQAVGSGGLASRIKAGIKIPSMPQKKTQVDPEEEPDQPKPKARQQAKQSKKIQEEEPEDEDENPNSGKGDVVSKIKDYLGIM